MAVGEFFTFFPNCNKDRKDRIQILTMRLSTRVTPFTHNHATLTSLIFIRRQTVACPQHLLDKIAEHIIHNAISCSIRF